MAARPQHEKESTSRHDDIGPPGPHWSGLVAVLRTLPAGGSRVVVVLATIGAVASVALVVCWRAGTIVGVGGVSAGAVAVYRRYQRALGFLRGAQ
jgi:hypothetical protein